MKRYALRQLVQLAVVIVGISMLAFAILHVIGDPVTLLLPQNAGKEEYERYHKLLGLDQPIYVQYWKFASRAVQGDFGKSWYTDTPAFKLVIERMPPTLYLTIAGLGMALLIALPLGILAALKRHSLGGQPLHDVRGGGPGDAPLLARHHAHHHLRGAAAGCCPPPATGPGSTSSCPPSRLGAFLAPITMRLVRSGVIEVMSMDYIKTARAKGVAEWMVVVKHAFRNACIPVITVLGLQFGQLLGGAIVTETVFAWPGRGHADRGLDPQPGLPGGPVRGGAARPHHRGHQLRRGHDRRATSTRASGWARERGAGRRGGARERRARLRRARAAGDRCAGSGGSSGAWPPRWSCSLIVFVTPRRAVDRALQPGGGGHPAPARRRPPGWRAARPSTGSAPIRSGAISSRA